MARPEERKRDAYCERDVIAATLASMKKKTGVGATQEEVLWSRGCYTIAAMLRERRCEQP